MNGKTAKLLRKVARTNPYGVKNMNEDITLYGKHRVTGSTVVAPGFRSTYKMLKKFYKQRMFTTTDLRNELVSINLKEFAEY